MVDTLFDRCQLMNLKYVSMENAEEISYRFLAVKVWTIDTRCISKKLYKKPIEGNEREKR
jgi:hypothetical protein